MMDQWSNLALIIDSAGKIKSSFSFHWLANHLKIQTHIARLWNKIKNSESLPTYHCITSKQSAGRGAASIISIH